MKMVAAITYEAESGSSAVSPVDRPTVPNAEITSNSTWLISALVIWAMTIVDSATIVAPMRRR